MADSWLVATGPTAPIKVKLVDNGDGTFSIATTLATDPNINIGDVGILGDDNAVLVGSKSDAIWDGAAASPTWTALLKYVATKLGIAQAPVAPGAATATKSMLVGAQYDLAPGTRTDGQQGTLEADAKGNLRGVVMDAAGNARGANVTAANAVEIDPSAARRGSLTARSGAIAAGGTSQQLAAAAATRKYLLIQNPKSAAGQNIATPETLYIRFGASNAGVNDGTSFEIEPGGSLVMEGSFVSTEAIQVNAATIAHKWIAVEG